LQVVGHNLIDGRQLEIELPIKTPRYTNVAKFNVMLGAKASDLLVREENHTGCCVFLAEPFGD
jgi:hypothetical protein